MVPTVGRQQQVDSAGWGAQLETSMNSRRREMMPIRAQYFNPGANALPSLVVPRTKKARFRNAFRVVFAVSQTKAAIHPADLLFER